MSTPLPIPYPPSLGGAGDLRKTNGFSPSRFLVLSVLAMLAVRAAVAASVGLSDDEAYYRLWSLAPALSYVDHPPMVGWLIALGRAAVGDNELGVRLPGLISFLIGTAALWRAASVLFGRRIAETAVLFTLAMPLLGVGGIIVTPDGPSVLFAGLTFWALAELVRSGDANWWLAVGLFAGLGLLGKYTNLFVGAGIVLWLVAVPAQRRWFAAWQLWAGGAIAVLCTLPVFVWNAQNGWASFTKQFGRVARGNELTGRFIGEMAGGFVALASPVIAALAVWGLYLLMRRALARRETGSTLAVAMILPGLAYFFAHALHARVQGNWPAPLYPPLAICAAVALHCAVSPRWQHGVKSVAIAAGLLMTALIYFHSVYPVAAGYVRKDPTDQLRGWPGLAEGVDRLRSGNSAAWIATSSYATAAQLAFALKGRLDVHQINERIRYVHLPQPPEGLVRQPALYVELERRQLPELLERKFRVVKRLGNLTRRIEQKDLATYAVYFVAEPREPLFEPP